VRSLEHLQRVALLPDVLYQPVSAVFFVLRKVGPLTCRVAVVRGLAGTLDGGTRGLA